ncbi:MAG: electron transfer flavoprotein subunit alpha/FixB family protein, partial [Planctomycetes bacterium]|nr:electron transfer flavoprotein subunit alpha/FixB family protein [Planctomycetota bacterium]
MAGEILVIAEHKDGTVRSASLQALTAAAGLAAASGATVAAVACGPS